MIQLKAITSGYAVPRGDFDATVHSVFHEVANLLPGRTDRLLTLASGGCADLPQGLRIATAQGFSFEACLQAGDRFSCRSGVLADAQGQIEIDLTTAKPWKCHLPTLVVDDFIPGVIAAWTMAWKILNQRQGEMRSDIHVEALFQLNKPKSHATSVKIGALTRALVAAVRECDDSFEPSLAELIGLGGGLTPSGDDFLVGFLAGLHCLAGDRADRLKYLRGLGKLVIRLSHSTNDISRTYLYHAAHGQVSSRLANLAQLIVDGTASDRALAIANEAMHEGHTSGMDSVSGLLVGFATWGDGRFPV